MKAPAPWDPTPEQFRSYLEREVQHAIVNLAKNAERDTLHSPRVICAATQVMRERSWLGWGSMPKDPRRFSSPPRRRVKK